MYPPAYCDHPPRSQWLGTLIRLDFPAGECVITLMLTRHAALGLSEDLTRALADDAPLGEVRAFPGR